MKKIKVYNLMVVDESGSMDIIRQQTINGFNETLQTILAAQANFPEQEHLVSLVCFNTNGTRTLHDCVKASKANMLSAATYKPDCGTPLYDALGESLTRLRYKINQQEEHQVLVTILTDGEENASKEFNHKMIRNMIDDLKKAGWTFTFIGANIDVEKTAMDLSVDNFLAFKQTDKDTQVMFAQESKARMNYMANLSSGYSKEELSKKYFEEK